MVGPLAAWGFLQNKEEKIRHRAMTKEAETKVTSCTLEISRRENREAPEVFETFTYNAADRGDTVATALQSLNKDLEKAGRRPIRWENSCLQKKCGACAMVINRRPALACDARLEELGQRIRLEPLRKFPVIEDLAVDREILFRNLETLRSWLETESIYRARSGERAYEAARCLQCGCCLEVCPNFSPGGFFTGTASAMALSRLLSQTSGAEKKDLAKRYRKHVFEGCGKSLACRNICPAGIDVDALLASSALAAILPFLSGK